MAVAVVGAAACFLWPSTTGQRLVGIEVADPDALAHGKLGVANPIPVRVTNRTDRPIRIVGNTAC